MIRTNEKNQKVVNFQKAVNSDILNMIFLIFNFENIHAQIEQIVQENFKLGVFKKSNSLWTSNKTAYWLPNDMLGFLTLVTVQFGIANASD